MTRRMALALAVALTTVVAFGLVAMGRESGLFGGAGAGDDTLASAQQPTPSPASATPDLEPDVTTEYIYLDESPAPQASHSADAGSPSGEVAPENSSHDDDDDAWEDDEREDEDDEDEHHEDEHEDEHEHEHESEWDD